MRPSTPSSELLDAELALARAVRNGDWERASKAAAAGARGDGALAPLMIPREPSAQARPIELNALQWSAASAPSALLRALAANGANLDTRGPKRQGPSPLALAILGANEPNALTLLDLGAKADGKSPGINAMGLRAFGLASFLGSAGNDGEGIARELLIHCALASEQELRPVQAQPEMVEAIAQRESRLERIALALIGAGARPDRLCSKSRGTPFQLAMAQGADGVACAMAASEPGLINESALGEARRKGCPRLAAFLLASGVRPNPELAELLELMPGLSLRETPGLWGERQARLWQGALSRLESQRIDPGAPGIEGAHLPRLAPRI